MNAEEIKSKAAETMSNAKETVEAIASDKRVQDAKASLLKFISDTKAWVVFNWSVPGWRGKAKVASVVAVAFTCVVVVYKSVGGKEKSPIDGLLGYKLGEVFDGQLGNPAILIGADWYCVDNRVEFNGYSTCIKVLPKTKKICAIHVASTDPDIDLKTELATVETMLNKKYKDMKLKKVNDLVMGWMPEQGTCALLFGIMQHPMAPCVKIEVHDVALEAQVEKEKNDILQDEARQKADKAGDVL